MKKEKNFFKIWGQKMEPNKANIESLQLENDKLKKENTQLLSELSQKEKSINKLISDIENSHKNELITSEKRIGSALKERELQAQLQTWEKIVDEMAHSINTDVFVAINSLEEETSTPKIKKAKFHISQIRDLINLYMWYIKREELSLSGDVTELDLSEIINSQINLIREGISTIRISTKEHRDNLIKMKIEPDFVGDLRINVTKEIKECVGLIIKDLLRNAFKNTIEESPRVEIRASGEESRIHIEIENNKAISNDFAEWFNGQSDEEPNNIAKSTKVGLRVIKMWLKLLKINAKLIPDSGNDSTKAIINFERTIKYEKH